ncbi:hypothetical protein A6D6_00696 [Alcanivorax xiamenensis]|uniref:Uncharacterized protein n=1 Tax=Alcanivorax xiamenensis TaxID=1177156 RepID=A0ABQ6YD17_9GAMM|nr:hypothetical protein A6D6_00696 [Alcanivorax xiamenensis]
MPGHGQDTENKVGIPPAASLCVGRELESCRNEKRLPFGSLFQIGAEERAESMALRAHATAGYRPL